MWIQDRPTRFDCKCVNFYGRDCPPPATVCLRPRLSTCIVKYFIWPKVVGNQMRKMNDSLTSFSGYTLYCKPGWAYMVKCREISIPYPISIPSRLAPPLAELQSKAARMCCFNLRGVYFYFYLNFIAIYI